MIATPGETPDVPREATRRARDVARLARIFGDTLPDTTADERDTDPRENGSGDDWLRSQVPPHHG
ncbi:hypothetical protein IU433_08695 [Nocardia puris]|nr:hypothetical protein [Nocardia puris]MBF6214804.1 hypothetical protein [Nocardia puris]MBF6364187.1 hypothetical protein [Nocardia puris]MBF6459116.1 hypothetical protein [Nocardia puris]